MKCHTLLFLTFLVFVPVNPVAFGSTNYPHAPLPPKCEIRTSSWCIAEGFAIIQRERADDSTHNRIWILSHHFMPESKLIILEPSSCKTLLANDVELIDVSPNHIWRNTTWNRIVIKLNSSNGCNLTLLLPPKTDNPMQWQYNFGLSSIVPCSNSLCDDASFIRFRELIESRLYLQQ